MIALENKRDTRQAILLAGERALAKYGFRKLTMEDIANEGGLAKRTLYLHFRNKSEICLAVVDALMERSYLAMEESLSAGGPGIEQLRRVLLVRLLNRIENFKSFHHSLAETMRELVPGKVEDFQTLAAPDIEYVRRAIVAGQEDGTVRRCVARKMAELLVRGSNGFLPSAVGTQEMASPRELRLQVEEFIDVLVRGMSAG